jgi:hypothetical protein
MTPTLTRLVMAARAPHRRLSHHLDTQEHPIVVDTRGIPQVIPAPLYAEHLAAPQAPARPPCGCSRRSAWHACTRT